jgi:hypothetical protein
MKANKTVLSFDPENVFNFYITGVKYEQKLGKAVL